MTDPRDRLQSALKRVESDFAKLYRIKLDDSALDTLRIFLRDGWDKLDREGDTEAFPSIVSGLALRLGAAVAASVAVAGDDGDESYDLREEQIRERVAGLTLSGKEIEMAFNRLCPGFWPFC